MATAIPPREVSLSSDGMERPTAYMTPMVSSMGVMLFTPARESSAEISALEAPMAFRFWQGFSTRPPMGSQTRPRMLTMAKEAASMHCLGVPPKSSTAADAAMALAEPTSAWQPPSAPAVVAFLVIR